MPRLRGFELHSRWVPLACWHAPLSLRTIRRATMPSPKRLESTFSVRLKFQLHRHGELCEIRARKKRKNAGRPSINHVF